LAMSESLTTTMSGQVTSVTGLTIYGAYSRQDAMEISSNIAGAMTAISGSNPVYILYNPLPAGIVTSGQQANTVNGIGSYLPDGGTGNFVVFRVMNEAYTAPVNMNLSWTVTTQGMNGLSLTSSALFALNSSGNGYAPIVNPIISKDGGSSTTSVTLGSFGEYTSGVDVGNDSSNRNAIFLNLDLTGTPSNNGVVGSPDSVYIQHVLVLSEV